MTRKLLIITPRIPDTSTAKNARAFARIVCLARSFEVHLVYIQSMFVKEAAVRDMEKAGVKVIPFSQLKHRKDATLETQVRAATGAETFDLLLFNTHFAAKYYLPYLEGYARGGVVVIDACNSPYVSESRLERECSDFEDRVQLLKSMEINRMKEVAVYHNADAVLVDTEVAAEALHADIPSVDVFAYPGHEADQGAALCRLFASLRKKAPPAHTPDTVPIIRMSGGQEGRLAVGSLNDALRRMTGDFAFIVPETVIVPGRSFERLLLSVQSNPRYGIAVPSSTLEFENMPGISEPGNEFLQKHYIANFGFWKEVRQINGACLLIRKQLRDDAGLLDMRFTTMHYALFDYCLKAIQAGYTTIMVNESFVFYPDPVPADDRNARERDRALLYRKWCDAGTEYLEEMVRQAL